VFCLLRLNIHGTCFKGGSWLNFVLTDMSPIHLHFCRHLFLNFICVRHHSLTLVFSFPSLLFKLECAEISHPNSLSESCILEKKLMTGGKHAVFAKEHHMKLKCILILAAMHTFMLGEVKNVSQLARNQNHVQPNSMMQLHSQTTNLMNSPVA